MKISIEIKDGDQLERIKSEGGAEIEVYLDDEGLEFLLSQLSFLKDRRTDHIHFMTAAWGGGELTDEIHNASSLSVHHMRVLLISE